MVKDTLFKYALRLISIILMLIPLIDAQSATNNEFAGRTGNTWRLHVRQPRCETAEISRESLVWLWYLNYGHFYTLLVWHVSRLIAVRFGIGDMDTWRRRSFTLHSRAEWVARGCRPSLAGLNLRYPFKERRSMTYATTRHVVDNGGKKWGRREEATINRVPYIRIFSSAHQICISNNVKTNHSKHVCSFNLTLHFNN